ncbi:kinesin-like protein [Trichonephila clavipes]|nr:kinesin-like protein [Trichonephila clavipes]
MDWPAYSPDLSPIEHVWDMLGRRIAARQPPPTCLPELRRALLDEWCNIPQDQIDNLILSLPRRCFWQLILCEVNDAQNYLQTEGLNIHQSAQKISALLTVLEAKREEFVDDALMYA